MSSVGMPMKSHSKLHFIKLKRSMPNSVYMERAFSAFMLWTGSDVVFLYIV